MSKSNGFADFSQLEALSNRLSEASRMSEIRGSTFDVTKLVRNGGYTLMNGLIENTPVAASKSKTWSNWFRYTYAPTAYGIGYSFPRGTMFGDVHHKCTLARGWVVGPTEVIDRAPDRKPTKDEGKAAVNRTTIQKVGRNLYQLEFVNSAPYSMAVEKGHKNKIPRIMGGDGNSYFRYTPGKYFTEKTVQQYREKIWNDTQKEAAKMLRKVVRGR